MTQKRVTHRGRHGQLEKEGKKEREKERVDEDDIKTGEQGGRRVCSPGPVFKDNRGWPSLQCTVHNSVYKSERKSVSTKTKFLYFFFCFSLVNNKPLHSLPPLSRSTLGGQAIY